MLQNGAHDLHRERQRTYLVPEPPLNHTLEARYHGSSHTSRDAWKTDFVAHVLILHICSMGGGDISMTKRGNRKTNLVYHSFVSIIWNGLGVRCHCLAALSELILRLGVECLCYTRAFAVVRMSERGVEF